MVKDDIWDIKDKQQTQIKLDIFRKYLKAWAIIIGSYFPRAYFIDCFAGRGKYHNGTKQDSISGSPIIGLETAIEIKKMKQKKGKNFNLDIIAIDSNKENMADLENFIKELIPGNEIEVKLIENEFEKAIPRLF